MGLKDKKRRLESDNTTLKTLGVKRDKAALWHKLHLAPGRGGHSKSDNITLAPTPTGWVVVLTII